MRLTGEQLSDIVNDQTTPIALMSNRLLDMPEGGLPDFLNWWLVLRAALDGRRIHARGDSVLSPPLITVGQVASINRKRVDQSVPFISSAQSANFDDSS